MSTESSSSQSLPPLSASQKRAVQHSFSDALVTAGAGSGKTRVLSERFVHLVRGKDVPLRRLAALTFTEKAAAQMRARIADLFRRHGHEEQSADVEFAPISTIHAFCALLLRQHAIEAGVDPAFRVLDGVESELLLTEAAQLAENGLTEEQRDLLQAFAFLGHEPRAALLDLLRNVRGAGLAPEEVEWQAGGGDLLAAAAGVQEALEDFSGIDTYLPEERQPAHGEALRRIEEALQGLRGDDEDLTPFLAAGAQAAVAGLKGPRQRAYTGGRKAMEVALAALTGALLDVWGERILLPALKEILRLYEDAYSALKDERTALDFTDLELRTRDVLLRTAQANKSLDLAPAGLLVDEFQDTNPLQAEILELLRAHAPQFSVGDPKQSIYRFRGADVSVILAEEERVGADACHPMNASYRACKELVGGINALNDRLFDGGAAGVRYEPLEAVATYAPAPDAPLEFVVVDAGSESKKDQARPLEAAWIAERIAQLTDGTHMRLKQGPDGESVGPIRRGDIAILVRSRKGLPHYEAALEARGIPFLTQSSVGFFVAEEISDLMEILRVVHNPDDRYALACAAAGPTMGASSGELLRWFGEGEVPPWERMVAEASAGGPHAAAVRALQLIREEAVRGSMARAVEMVLYDLGLLETALLLPGGDRCAANLRKAVAFARRLDESGRRGLGDLLRHLETLREREMGEAEAPVGGEADDVVRLTTIHSAKGLEYPVVFVADVGSQTRSNSPTIFFDGKRRLSARVSDPFEGLASKPAGYDMISAADKTAGEEESLRLLYVAMTRAEERLLLTGVCTGTTKSTGQPKLLYGWGRTIWNALGAPFEPGDHALELDQSGTDVPARVCVRIVDGATVPQPERAGTSEPVTPVPSVEVTARERAELVLGETKRPVAPLGHTRYVVSVSELLTFAASPQRYYTECVIGAGARAAASALWDAPAQEDGSSSDGSAPVDGRRAARLIEWDETEWDEASDANAGLGDAAVGNTAVGNTAVGNTAVGRAAIGRAVHAVIERLGANDTKVPAALLDLATREEDGDDAFRAAVAEMSERFVHSDVGVQMRAALSSGSDVRREVDFHARIRFPGGERVAGFDSLLVKGSIDLWLPTPEGVQLIDHKTNQAGALFRTPEDLARHYSWQLRLYTLAAERLLGEDVAGAGLLLLDPGWGAQAVDVPVDISGDALEETRRLCRAFAIAELEGRYPATWQALLA